MIGTTIGRFEIVAPIAPCATGLLYQANDPKTNDVVAIRIMSVPDAGESMVQRFRDAAKAASVLESPNIPKIFGGGQCDAGFYVVMEYVEGLNLCTLLRQKRLPRYEVLDLCRQACSALDHAAARGMIVHPNLTPRNVIVESDGTLKILDFELPQKEERAATPESLERLAYLSPEQVRGEALDRRSNLYSWGAILYEMVSGKPPFAADNADDLRRSILEEIPAAPHELNSAWDPSVSPVILKALSKAPQERFASGLDLIRELEGQRRQTVLPTASVFHAEEKVSTVPRNDVAGSTSASSSSSAGTVRPAPIAPPPSTAASRAAAPFQTPAAAPPPVINRTANAVGRGRGPDVESPVLVVRPKPSYPANPSLDRKSYPARKITSTHVAALACLLCLFSLAGGLYVRHRRAQPAPLPAITAASPSAEQPQGFETPERPPSAETPAPEAAPTQTRKQHRPTRVAAPEAPIITTGDLDVSSTPAGAEVHVDGQRDPGWVTPHTFPGLSTGQHTIVVVKPNYAPQSHIVQVSAGRKSVVAVKLAELPAVVAISSIPSGGAILIDGKESGQTPSQLAVANGTHTIAVRKPGFFDAMITVQLAIGQNFSFSPTLKQMGNAASVKPAGRLNKFFGGAPHMAAVQVKTWPKGARVVVNDRALHRPAPLEFFLQPGNYEVAIMLEGYKPVRRLISLEGGTKTVIDEALEKQ